MHVLHADPRFVHNHHSVHFLPSPAFMVHNPAVGNACFRKTSDMEDRADETSPDGSVHVALEEKNELIKVAEGKWLPKKFLVEMDTSKPCVFQTFCDALKTSQVTEVDFSACGLTSPAVEILSDWVRDATAGLTEVDVHSNRGLDEAAVAALRAAAPETCKILADY